MEDPWLIRHFKIPTHLMTPCLVTMHALTFKTLLVSGPLRGPFKGAKSRFSDCKVIFKVKLHVNANFPRYTTYTR